MQLSSIELEAVLGGYFPKAVIYCLDRNYEIVPRKTILKSLKRFHRSVTLFGLTKWVANKMDCDKWSWLFKGFHIVKGYYTRKDYARAIGLMCFYIDGKPFSGHAINVAVVEVGGEIELLEIDAIPGKGAIELSLIERESTWLIII